jgi:hypothetical protein
MKNALGMKSTGFKLWKIAAVAGACMALAAFGGTTAAFAQSVPASEGWPPMNTSRGFCPELLGMIQRHSILCWGTY